MLEGLRGDDSIAELCRNEGITQSLYYTWSKEFMEACKRRLAGDMARAATTDEFNDFRHEARDLRECVADLILENRLLKKLHDRAWGRRRMRYPASEKPESIRIVDMALEQTDLSPREMAVRFTDKKRYFISEATIYRQFKAHDLITSPAYTVIKAAETFHKKSMRPIEM